MYGNVSQQAVQIPTAVVPKCVVTILHKAIVHLVFETQRDLPICVHRLYGHPYSNVSQQQPV